VHLQREVVEAQREAGGHVALGIDERWTSRRSAHGLPLRRTIRRSPAAASAATVRPVPGAPGAEELGAGPSPGPGFTPGCGRSSRTSPRRPGAGGHAPLLLAGLGVAKAKRSR
jgi:hypothetical protein